MKTKFEISQHGKEIMIKDSEGNMTFIEDEKLIDFFLNANKKQIEYYHKNIDDAMLIEQAFENNSELIGDDIFSLEQVAGKLVMVKRDFELAVKEIIDVKSKKL